MKHLKYFLFPIIIIIAVIVLSFLNIHGSSIGLFEGLGGMTTESNPYIFGKGRYIRSDEYLVSTPTVISQDINKEPTINPDIGDGMNYGFHYNMPTRNLFTIFKPATWIFLITDNIEFSFSFFWWTRIALLLISVYLLLLEFTNKNLFFSITGSLLLYFTPFIQWWLAVDTIIPIAFGLYFFFLIIKEHDTKKEILYTLALTYWIISFGIIMYPAFQVPLAWFAIFIALGFILKNKDVLNKKKTVRIVLSLSFSIVISIAFVLLFLWTFRDATNTMMNTAYPGSRFIPAGLGNIFHLQNGFYNILMQFDTNGAPYGNQCEASNFFNLFIFLIPWVIYKLVIKYIKTKKIDWITISLISVLVLFMLWYFIPLPDWFSRFTALYLTLPQRLFIGFGIVNYLLIINILSNKDLHLDLKSKKEIIIALLLVIATGITFYLTGKYLYNLNPQSFLIPTFLSPQLKILGVTGLTSLIVILILVGKKIGIAILLIYAFLSTFAVNPIYRGLDIIIHTEMATYMRTINDGNQNRWIVYGDYHYAQYLLANNGRILNGIHMYPQFKIWSIIDSQGEYKDIYNRYAHVFFSDYSNGDELVVLKQTDSIEVNISPCDEKLKMLDVKYVLSTEDLQDTSCLSIQKTFGKATIYKIIN